MATPMFTSNVVHIFLFMLNYIKHATYNIVVNFLLVGRRHIGLAQTYLKSCLWRRTHTAADTLLTVSLLTVTDNLISPSNTAHISAGQFVYKFDKKSISFERTQKSKRNVATGPQCSRENRPISTFTREKIRNISPRKSTALLAILWHVLYVPWRQ